MPDFLTHPLWTPVGVVTATLLGLAALWLARRPRKALEFKYLALPVLVPTARTSLARVKILFDDQPIQNLLIARVTLLNTGNIPITTDDYESEVKIKITSEDDSARILEVRIADTKPVSLESYVKFTNDQHEVRIAPLLLNHGDQFEITMLVTGNKYTCGVEGRIAGIKNIPLYNNRRTRSWLVVASLLLIGTFSTCAFGAWYILSQYNKPVGWALVFSGLLFSLCFALWMRKLYEWESLL